MTFKLLLYITFFNIAYCATNLVLVGGDLDPNNAEIFDKMISIAGGKGVAKIGVITAASVPPEWDRYANDPDEAANSVANAQYYIASFKQFGALEAQWIPIDILRMNNNANATVVSQIESMTGFFFGGGDQNMLRKCLMQGVGYHPSPALAAITRKFSQGALIGGTSAGTMSQVGMDSAGFIPLITGGSSYLSFTEGEFTYAEYEYSDQQLSSATNNPNGGLGHFPYGILDTHFSQRGRQGRVLRLAWDTNTQYAFGVDQNTALVVNDNGSGATMTVMGEGGAYIFDLSYAYSIDELYVGASAKKGGKKRVLAETAPIDMDLFNLFNVSVNYLTDGDTFYYSNPLTTKINFASYKTPIKGHESRNRAMSPYSNIFDENVFTDVAQDLFDSKSKTTSGYTYESSPTYQIRMTKENSSRGYKGTNKDGSILISFEGLTIDIYPTFNIIGQ